MELSEELLGSAVGLLEIVSGVATGTVATPLSLEPDSCLDR